LTPTRTLDTVVESHFQTGSGQWETSGGLIMYGFAHCCGFLSWSLCCACTCLVHMHKKKCSFNVGKKLILKRGRSIPCAGALHQNPSQTYEFHLQGGWFSSPNQNKTMHRKFLYPLFCKNKKISVSRDFFW